jgi:beta-aspartyl-peptidase (threonine type)
MRFKHAGRVGDSPLVGCGIYADNQAGGVACTGWGEGITRVVMAKTALDLVKAGKLVHEAASLAVEILRARVGGRGGLIMVDRLGNVSYAYTTGALARAYIQEGMDEPVVGT